MRKVIIIGGNHHNTLGIIRALGQGGEEEREVEKYDDRGSDYWSDEKKFCSHK